MLWNPTAQRTWTPPLLFVLIVGFSLASMAQTAPRVGLAAFDATHPVTLQGTIQQLVSHPAPGTLLGEHLMVATTTGMHDVHIGPYVLKGSYGKAIHPNASVIIVGSPVNLKGKQVFLAQQLVVNGQTIPVRNQNGFLIHPPGTNSQRHAQKTFGGAQ